jgi:hypothetical protein
VPRQAACCLQPLRGVAVRCLSIQDTCWASRRKAMMVWVSAPGVAGFCLVGMVLVEFSEFPGLVFVLFGSDALAFLFGVSAPDAVEVVVV